MSASRRKDELVVERPQPPSRPAQEHAPQESMVVGMFEGPLPPPHVLAEYERSCPGLAERLIQAFEQESAHRRSLERAEMEHHHALEQVQVHQNGNLAVAQQALARRGQLCALAVALGGFGVAALLGSYHYPTAATIIGSLDLVALVGLFLSGGVIKNNSRKSPKTK